jgi:hypothetical protein
VRGIIADAAELSPLRNGHAEAVLAEVKALGK